MWELQTLEKKNVTQVETWINDSGSTITLTIGWRWGSARYKEKPDLGNYNPDTDQVEIWSIGDTDDWEMDDGCWEDFEFSDDISEEEQERLMDIHREDPMGLEDEGWHSDDFNVYFAGPLELTEKE